MINADAAAPIDGSNSVRRPLAARTYSSGV
jgi:hypothetical protein